MGYLAVTVHHDLNADVAVARFVGQLTLRSALVVRSTLVKCLADCPSAMVVDLQEVDVLSPVALTVLPAVEQRSDFLPDVPMLVSLPYGVHGNGHVATSLGCLPCYESTRDALNAAASVRNGLHRKELSASMNLHAPSDARLAVRQACVDWDLDHLANVAELVTSELVTNAIKHARTGVDFEVLLRGNFLHLRVRDQSTAVPRMRARAYARDREATGGQGLRLVDVYASGWGYTLSGGGKVVWATLRARPPGHRQRVSSVI